MDITPETGAGKDEGSGRDTSVRRRILPTSLGLSTVVPAEAKRLAAIVEWGDYFAQPPLDAEVLESGEATETRKKLEWERVPRRSDLQIEIKDGKWEEILPGSQATARKDGALCLHVICRPTTILEPEGPGRPAWSLTAFVVNRRAAVAKPRRYQDLSYAFQVRLTLECEEGFEAGHDLTGYASDDLDLRTYDLHYHDVASYAAGRNTASRYQAEEDGVVRRVWTEPLPTAEVERVAPNEAISDVTFEMKALEQAAIEGPAAIRSALAAFPSHYAEWIDAQRPLADGFAAAPRRKEMAETLIRSQAFARARIEDGIELLATNDHVRLAFRKMNEAIERAAPRRFAAESSVAPEKIGPLKWRPFQLAFILINFRGLTEKGHPERELVDLLFFPTGGGKTEAYLGLTAYMIAYRRLTASGVLGAGVSVIMRYSLRLLTLDQMGRAAGVICALELMRESSGWTDDDGKRLLGDWPIEIGLWIGAKASPNKLGGLGDTGDKTAVTRVRAFKKRGANAPAPIRASPWCGTPFDRSSFDCKPNFNAPKRMEIRCANIACDFTRDRPFPILTVDEEIYRRLPAFIIATIDKFAALPWVGETGAFFGHVDRHDADGFYGAAEPREGYRLGNEWSLDPPDLIVQDELHLISGPLGTVAGLYETAIDGLATRRIGETRIRPKIVASTATATARRAESQIQALFDRDRTAIFPPPGVDRRDSFFAVTRPSDHEPARLYLGIAALGRGPKLVFLRALTSVCAAAVSDFQSGAGQSPSPADPYMTALCYFNALRELRGARWIVEDEVRERARRYGGERRRLKPTDQPFLDRDLAEPIELTSRESTDAVAKAKRRLDTPAGTQAAVDIALATNMISIGLEITRLGLMLVMGQPKMVAEYIQATSRVGRDAERPGLVIALLNVHKPRDRAHFERFGFFHEAFYRAVEATSVTPWAARALDRALAAVLVSAIRHLEPSLTAEDAAGHFAKGDPVRTKALDLIEARACRILSASEAVVFRRMLDRLADDWAELGDELTQHGATFRYCKRGPNGLLSDPLDPDLDRMDVRYREFIASHSMRDVESAVGLEICRPDRTPLGQGGSAP